MRFLHPILLRRLQKNVYAKYTYCSSSKTKVCIVGSGPAGFYTAQQIMQDGNIQVDMYEKLPVPFGLIRYGVAPDHPEIKNVINSFTKTALDKQFNFYGNVNVGHDVTVSELLKAYHGVVLAYGASRDRELDIPGKDAKNVLPAREFVGWYNGLPEHSNLTVDLDTDVAAIVGQGNVALDVARMLLRNSDELKTTDVTEYAFEALKKSKIRKVVLIGRRGPLQVSFTIKEFREMTKLKGCSAVVTPSDFEGVAELIPSIGRPKKRLVELMLKIASESSGDIDVKDVIRHWELKFCRSPKAILIGKDGKVEKLKLCINKLEGSFDDAEVRQTDEEEILDCGLVVKSVGYRSSAIDSFVPFNEKSSVIPNNCGRVLERIGLYCSGWVKTGPVGVILSTMNGSFETGEKILADLKSGDFPSGPRGGGDEIVSLLQSKGIPVVTFDHWLKIDEIEQEKGQKVGKPREKIVSLQEMLQVATST